MKKTVRPRLCLSNRLRLVDRREAMRAGLAESDLHQPHEVFLRNARQLVLRETWVESPLPEGWIAAYRLVPEEGAPVVAEVRLFPNEGKPRHPGAWSGELLGPKAKAPPGGVTADLLRRLRVGEHLQIAGRILANWRASGAERMLDRHGLTRPPRRGPGRKGRPDRFYAQVARDYLAAVAAGSRRPARDVAQLRRLPPGRIRDMLYEARRRGLLTPATKQGRRGGDLTERGRAVLAIPPDKVAAADARRVKTPLRHARKPGSRPPRHKGKED